MGGGIAAMIFLLMLSIELNLFLFWAIYRLYKRGFAIVRAHPGSQMAYSHRGLEAGTDKRDVLLFLVDSKSGAVLSAEIEHVARDDVDYAIAKNCQPSA